MRKFILLVCFCFLVFGPTKGFGQGTSECWVPPDSDTTIKPAGSTCLGRCTDVTLSIPNSRVVGPGTDSELSPDGQLLSPDIYKQNNVVSATARVYLSFAQDAFGFGGGWNQGSTLTASVYLNGQFVASNTIQNIGQNCMEADVDSSALRFAHLGGAPGNNTATIHLSYNSAGMDGDVFWVPLVTINAITFKAMAPIVMVHGIHVNEKQDIFKNFETVFSDRKLPYTVLHFDEGTLGIIGDSVLPSQINQVLSQFGARHVHIIGHSAGGIWAREYLAHSLPPDLGVYSLTTISTPHHGSVSADVSFTFKSASVFPADPGHISPIPAWLFRLIVPTSSMTPLLTVDKMTAYDNDVTNTLPVSTSVAGRKNAVQYSAYSADANVDGSTDTNGYGTITCPPDACDNYQHGLGSLVPQYLYRLNQKWKQVILTTDSQGRYIVGLPSSGSPFPGNDFQVTVDSAQYTQAPAFANAGILLKNHHTVLDSDIGIQVANRFTSSSMQDDSN